MATRSKRTATTINTSTSTGGPITRSRATSSASQLSTSRTATSVIRRASTATSSPVATPASTVSSTTTATPSGTRHIAEFDVSQRDSLEEDWKSWVSRLELTFVLDKTTTPHEKYAKLIVDRGVALQQLLEIGQQEKMDALLAAPPPKSPSEVRSLLGLASYCSRFIPDYASIVEPLRQLSRKSTKWTSPLTPRPTSTPTSTPS